MAELGFTFYPKDWWTSESFFSLSPIERYFYLECIFLMYVNDGSIPNDKSNVERRLGAAISDSVWLKVVSLMDKDGTRLTHESVNKRLRKARANRENGKKGGRPPENNPNNPTKKPTDNPALESKREIERKRESEEDPTLYSIENCFTISLKDQRWVKASKATPEKLAEFNRFLESQAQYEKNPADYKKHFSNWVKKAAPVIVSHERNHREEKGNEIMSKVLGRS